MKIILIAAFCALSAFTASAQVLYSGGTYIQNFNSLSQDTRDFLGPVVVGNTDPWVDNSTLLGWYANQDTYTTAPTILGLSLLNQMTSAGTGSDRALGSYLGTVAALNPITYGLRIRNTTGAALTSFNMVFTLRDFTTGIGSIVALNVLDSFNLSYSTNATDVSGAGAANYNVIAGAPNLIGLNILSSTTDSSTVGFTVNNINVANGSDLWIRFERTGLLGLTDNSIGIDNVSVSAVPEPATYILIGLGLTALALCRKLQHHPEKKIAGPKIANKTAVLAAVLTLSSMGALSAQNSFELKTGDQNKVWFQSEGSKQTVSEKALREPFTGSWGRCTVSRGLDADGVPTIIVTMDTKSTATSFLFNDSVIKTSPGKTVVLYPLSAGTLPEISVVGSTPNGAPYVAQSTYKKPVHQQCTYKAMPDSAILQEDFDWAYGTSVQKEETMVIDSAKCIRTVDNYLISMTELPPANIWVRNESFIQRGPSPSSLGLKTPNGTEIPLMPVTRPDQLMPTLKASELFSDMSVEQYHSAFRNRLPQMERNSEQIRVLLAKWDTGTITPAEMKVLQSTSKVVWMIQCTLVDDKDQPPGGLFNSVLGVFTPNLSPEAATPFLTQQ